MLKSVNDYFRTLCQSFGDGWNRFWFTPSDPYPLGLIRFLTGLLAVYMHLTLTPDLVRFFAAGGWLPVEVVEQLTVRGTPVSYLNFIDSPTDLLLAHFAGLTALVLFAIGFWSRITSILALIVILSDIHRGPMLTSQFEPVLTMVMFYLCLGPSGASWSVDRWLLQRNLTKETVSPTNVTIRTTFGATVAIRLIQVHLAMLIAVMGFSKLLFEPWWSGLGTWWLIARPETRLVDLTDLPRYPINFWTHAIIFFELSFPVLIWIRLARPLLLAVGLSVWTSVAILTGQIPFALMLMGASLCYCSASWLRSVTAARA